MSKSYLDINQKMKRYIEKESYIVSRHEQSSIAKYAILPEEYDVFSELELEKFSNIGESQLQLLHMFLTGLREKLKHVVMHYGIVKILPKLSVYVDSDNALIVNWAYSNYRIFINIEKIVEESFYGIVAQDEEKNMFSNSGKFDNNNYGFITDKILDYIFNQS